MTGGQMEALRDALCEAFDQDSLDQMLRLRLDKKRAHLVEPGNYHTVVFKLIDVAIRQGWLSDLVRAAIAYNPENAALRRFCKENGDLIPCETHSLDVRTAPSAAAQSDLERRRDSYRKFWEQLEDAHLVIRSQNVDQPAFSAILRSVNTYIIKNSAYLESTDHELANRYLKLLREFRAFLIEARQTEVLRDWEDTVAIPLNTLSAASQGREMLDQINGVRDELLRRVKQVLAN